MNETVQKLMKDNGLSLASVADKLSMPKSTLSEILNGKSGDEKRCKIEKQIEEVITLLQNRKEFISTAQKAILSVLQMTYEESEFALITGASGIGKTHAIQKYIADHEADDVIYLDCDDAMSYSGLLDAICGQFGMTFRYQSSSLKLRNAIREAIKSGVKMIIIDEADLLIANVGRTILKKMNVLRKFYDAGIGVAMIGIDGFDKRIHEAGESYLVSRIGYKYNAKLPKYDEMIEFAKHVHGKDLTLKRAQMYQKNGAFRKIGKFFKNTEKVGEDAADAIMY